MVKAINAEDASAGWAPSAQASPELAALTKNALANPELVNERDSSDLTPLMLAASEGNWEICEWLVNELGADMEIFRWQGDQPQGVTALAIACSRIESSNAALTLLRLGANPHTMDEGGSGLMHRAVQTGSVELLLELARRGVDPGLKNKDGRTPLMLWAYCGPEPLSVDRGELLLAMDSDLNARDHSGSSALYLASAWGDGWADGIKMLLNAGANPNAQTSQGETPLIKVCRGSGEAKEVAAALLEAGADPYIRDNAGRCMAERWDQGTPYNGALATVGAWVEARALEAQINIAQTPAKARGPSL